MTRPLALLVLLGAASTPLAAQSRVAVLSEPGTPVIAAEVLVATGPRDEPAGKAGLAYLAARAVTYPILPVMDSLGAHLAVAAEKDALAFSLTAAPDVWEEASRVLMVALFRDPSDSVAVVRERATIQQELGGRAANPADASAREADAAFFGPDHPWGRPAVGSVESVQRLTVADVETFLRANLTPDRAVVAVVGPVEDARVREHLGTYLGGTRRPPAAAPPRAPRESPVRRDYNSITTWISASLPFAETADVEAIRFFAYLVSEELSFGPSRSSVHDARSDVFLRIGGGELRLQVVIPPDEAGQWASHVQRVIQEVGTRNLPDDVFAAHRRRYLGESLMRLLAPEDRAHEAARALLVGGREGLPLPEAETLTEARLRAAAASLGRPILVFLGPIMEQVER